MSMKVGVVATDAYRHMAGVLSDEGVEITLLTIEPESTLETCQAVASFMNSAKGYDLIHSIDNAAPLLFSRFVDTPMLTTIVRQPTAADLRIYLSSPGTCFFIAAPQVAAIEGLNTFDDIEPDHEHPGRYYRALYERIIKQHGREDRRPWGYYEVLSGMDGCHKVKRITVWPERRLSLQVHNRRKEHWFVISGLARVTLGSDDITLGPSETVDIPQGTVHRVENIGDEPLVFIEVQQGDYLGEDDIVRVEDDFGRA